MSPKNETEEAALKKLVRIYGEANPGDIDLWLLKENLAMTPWERMQANDDALNFGEMRTGMIEQNEKLKSSEPATIES